MNQIFNRLPHLSCRILRLRQASKVDSHALSGLVRRRRRTSSAF